MEAHVKLCYQSVVNVSDIEPVKNYLHPSAISFQKLTTLYKDCMVIGIIQIWIPDKGWRGSWQAKDESQPIQQQICGAAFDGAHSLCLKIEHKNGSVALSDYRLYELTNLPYVRV